MIGRLLHKLFLKILELSSYLLTQVSKLFKKLRFKVQETHPFNLNIFIVILTFLYIVLYSYWVTTLYLHIFLIIVPLILLMSNIFRYYFRVFNPVVFRQALHFCLVYTVVMLLWGITWVFIIPGLSYLWCTVVSYIKTWVANALFIFK